MQRHENLFSFYGNKTDVYRKLQDEYLRDQKSAGRVIYVFGVLLGCALFFPDSPWKPLLFLGACSTIIYYITIFIDLSNRNHLMHVIDWVEAKED